MQTVRARALAGFYRGEPLVRPGEIVTLSLNEFNELKGFNLVELAPPEEPATPPKTPAKPAGGK